MTYYDRIKNRKDRSMYESPEEKEERFRRLLGNQKISEQKELYKCECREEENYEEGSNREVGVWVLNPKNERLIAIPITANADLPTDLPWSGKERVRGGCSSIHHKEWLKKKPF